MTSFSSVYRSMIAIAIVSCSFVISVSAAGTIPRDSLRLELSLATGSLDTSGNNRPVTATGTVPIFINDPIYGVPYAQFNGSGGFTVNTTWNAGTSDDFTISMWIKIPENILVNNQSSTITNLTQWYYNIWGQGLNQAIYDKPMVLLSTKTTNGDGSNMRIALSKEGKCSINTSPKSMIYQNAYYGPSYHSDIYGSLDANFDCTTIKDGKWHNIILVRKSSLLKVSLDANSVWSTNSNITISKNISFGGMGLPMDSTYYNLYPASIKNDIYTNHFYRGGMTGFRLYSRALTDLELEALGDEYRYAQSDLIGAGNITLKMNGYIAPNLSLSLSGIAPNLSKDIVEYQYSLSGSSFLPITSITDISTSTGSLQYRVTLNMSSAKDGKNTVTLRVKSGDTYQNLGTVTFTKLDVLGTITINQPTTDIAPSKTITASTDIGAILYMSQTRSTVCDATITTWDDYSDLTFASKNDNGIRICYKSIYPSTNKIIYKLSTAINGIQSDEDSKNTASNNLFKNYLLWTKSIYPKPNDTTFLILDLLGVSAAQSQGTINGITMTDVNGDGLVDFIYSRNDPIRRAIIVNNGNYTFKTVYKCAIDAELGYNVWGQYGPTGNSIYYGDCADPTR